ncbi:MAG TPA: hypothetical protein VLB86_03335 [Gaiellaceae bacterium]|nr:hypothetical protein [Gaiellaceae bacterium]
MTVAAAEQLLLVSGSGYAPNANAPIGMEVLVDDAVVGRCRVLATQANTHVAFVPVFIPLTLAAASSPFAVTLRPMANTASDNWDTFEVALVE